MADIGTVANNRDSSRIPVNEIGKLSITMKTLDDLPWVIRPKTFYPDLKLPVKARSHGNLL
jgi:hypothetical protein